MPALSDPLQSVCFVLFRLLVILGVHLIASQALEVAVVGVVSIRDPCVQCRVKVTRQAPVLEVAPHGRKNK